MRISAQSASIFEEKQIRIKIVLAVLLSACLILSNVTASKLVDLGVLQVDGGTLFFPLTYIICDLLSEMYGFWSTRIIIMISMLANILVMLGLYASIYLPPADNIWPYQEGYAGIFGLSPRIFVASILSYACGELLNSYTLSRLKITMRGRWLPLRALFSTFLGASIDSMLFCSIAFYNVFPLSTLFEMGAVQIMVKVAYESCFIPLMILLLAYFKSNKDTTIEKIS
jgi:uncharacterized integral membrane protein (TIGR00697 family)